MNQSFLFLKYTNDLFYKNTSKSNSIFFGMNFHINKELTKNFSNFLLVWFTNYVYGYIVALMKYKLVFDYYLPNKTLLKKYFNFKEENFLYKKRLNFLNLKIKKTRDHFLNFITEDLNYFLNFLKQKSFFLSIKQGNQLKKNKFNELFIKVFIKKIGYHCLYLNIFFIINKSNVFFKTI